ncbi:bifunctional 3'-5' exonuclease/DNA polymerase [uncultured Caudovirales phage]|uniref:DNA-directed DNA polymerase n=1 Tax=uncultured Caudovirales phage TaxID=2100421 RepID=A0A6J5SDB7_9CAUD|nr:bifunctional 3'-5' exonuclease/DNA polymerase [uncultured Caudovirales phage]CAB4211870.1 bifunctional 3'-5' exonuclease/DNA polymerase [uncultured Caudovirales phage]
MKQPKPTTVDFETFGIEGRPKYPPVPVGVSIKEWGKAPKYYSWGHRSQNNSTWSEARLALQKAWNNPDGVLFQNSKFDVDVAEAHMYLPIPNWSKIHDTMFLLFLDDPHQRELGLKPSAARLLNMPADEQDAVVEWLVKNQPVPNVKIGKSKNSKNPPGKYIAYAPGKLVGTYANGDTIRTEKLFELLWKKTAKRGMLSAYDRERQLMPVLLNSEKHGVRVDYQRLKKDVEDYAGWMVTIDEWIRKQLGNPLFPESRGSSNMVPVNIDSGAQLAEALIRAKKADPALMGVTATGAVQTNKDAISNGVTDKVMAGVLKYRAQLKTCLGTFMLPWLAMAHASGGFIFTTWNQVKGELGTRTGRLSSTPNFQNIPKEFSQIFRDLKDILTKHLPVCPWPNLPPLPLCRGYIIPYDEDHILLGRDYSQQEPRILAHFEGGELQEQYVINPWIDYHDNAKDHLERVMGRKYDRKPVKNINLGIIYGQGVGSLAEKNGSTVVETKEIRDAIYNLYPGLKDMYNDMKMRAKTNQPIRTWGGREYYCEPPALIDGRMMHFDYKMVNVLIQGSAADCTKEAVIRFDAVVAKKKKLAWRLLLQVHDEIVISVPKSDVYAAMEELKQCMESVEFDVQILSEGAFSADNWASMRDFDKKGKQVDAME